MPRIDPAANLQALLNSGSNRYVANALMRHLSEQQTLTEMRNVWPLAHTQTLQAAFQRGLQSYEAGQRLTTALPDDRLRASEVPRGPLGGLGYQYTVVASIYEGATGREIDRTFTIDSPASLTAEQLREQTYEAARQRYAPGTNWYTSTKLAPGWLINQYEVYSVQRA